MDRQEGGWSDSAISRSWVPPRSHPRQKLLLALLVQHHGITRSFFLPRILCCIRSVPSPAPILTLAYCLLALHTHRLSSTAAGQRFLASLAQDSREQGCPVLSFPLFVRSIANFASTHDRDLVASTSSRSSRSRRSVVTAARCTQPTAARHLPRARSAHPKPPSPRPCRPPHPASKSPSRPGPASTRAGSTCTRDRRWRSSRSRSSKFGRLTGCDVSSASSLMPCGGPARAVSTKAG